MSNQIKIGLFGFGCVGQGLYDVLENSPGFSAEIVKIAIKDATKPRSLSESYFTTDRHEILDNQEINLIVELIDDADQAYEIVKEALEKGKNVVSANKKMVAEHFEELVALQKANNASLLYEASCCGSIPVIRTLEEYYDNELLNSVSGIFNGSSNYILSKVQNENQSYEKALSDAQALGFAETDPTLDVGGYDPKYKLVILTGHSYGIFVDPNEVFNYGIENLADKDVAYAKAQGKKIKLVASASKVGNQHVSLFVLPQLIDDQHALYTVENEFNAVSVEAAFSEKQLFIGKGAGGHPTGSAVLSDISANRFGYGYEYRKHGQTQKYQFSNEVAIEVYVRYNDETVLSHLKFSNIKEEEPGYVLGTVELKQLIKAKKLFQKDGAFIATTGQVSFAEAVKVSTAFREETVPN